MKPVKQVLRPERVRRVPEQFSWVDQALVQQHFIDRCEPQSAALFLVTVADAQGLSYCGAATLAGRLHLSEQAFTAAREQLIALDLIAYRAGARTAVPCTSKLDAFKGQIVRWPGTHPYSAQQIFQRLAEAGFEGGISNAQGLRPPYSAAPEAGALHA